MKKILIALFSISSMASYAIERNFMEGYDIEPSAINTSESEGGLSLFQEKLAFSKRGKIYVAKLNDSLDIQEAEERSDLSALAIEGQFAQFEDQLYFSSNGELYCAKLEGEQWGNPQKLRIDGFGTTRVQEEGTTFISRRWTYKKESIKGMYNPAVSKQGKRIYFAGNLPDGKGGLDIWYIDRNPDNKTWSAPRNMEKVNSENDEDFPNVSGDTTFYFSSDRKDTLGGFNIYKTFLREGGEARIIAADFNSNANDKNFTVAGNIPFLISDRAGGDDIYRPAIIPTPIVETPPVDTTTVDTTPLKAERKDLRTVIFYFDFDKTTMVESYDAEFKYLYEFINENTTSSIIITGHTDERGSDEYNIRLSQGRAKAVYDKLIKMGIEKSRLTYKGEGKRNPALKNAKTGEEHLKNRRVEIEKQETSKNDKK